MADRKIAGAAFVLSANADKMVHGLNQAKGRVDKFKKETSDVWDKIGERFGGGGGGFIAKALGAGFFGGIAGSLAIKALNFVADGLSDVFQGTAKWTQELGRANFQAQLLERTFDRLLKVRDEWTAASSSPGERADRLEFERGEAGRGKNAAMAEVERLRKRLELINSFGLTNTGLALSGDLTREKAFGEAELARAEKEAAKYADRLGEVGERIKRLDPRFDPAVKAGLNSYVEGLRAEIEALGRTAEETKLKMMLDKGGPGGLLTKAREEFEAAAAAKAAHGAKEYADQLERQLAALQPMAKTAEKLKVIEHELAAARGGLSEKYLAGRFMGDADPADRVTEEHIKDLERMKKALESIDYMKLNNPAKEFVANLHMQRQALGFTANEARLLEMRLSGVNKKIIEEGVVAAALLEAGQKTKEAMSAPEMKFAGAMTAGSSEAYSFEMKHKFARPGGAADPNKGMTLWDVVMALAGAKKTLERIEAKVKPAGVL